MDNFAKQLIQSKLRKAALDLVNEERLRLAADVLEEDATSSVPGIVKWDVTDGIGPRRAYQFRHPETDIKYSIEPSHDKENLYHTSAFHPIENEHVSLGTYADPNAAAKAAREHHEGLAVHEAKIVSFATFVAEEEVGFARHRTGGGLRRRREGADREQKIYSLKQKMAVAIKTGDHVLLRWAKRQIHELGLSLHQMGFK